MNKNNLEFDVVSVDQNQCNLESLVVFQIQQVSAAVQRTCVGQFIKSSSFELEFPISIGRSKWNLFLFLNGQYEAGHPNETISSYLMLTECDNPSAEFKFNVEFQFGSEGTTVVKKNQRLCYANIKSRWLGVSLLKTTEMILNKSRFIRDDVLMLTVTFNELLKEELTASPELFDDYNCSISSESYVKKENKYIDPPDRSTKPVTSADRSPNSMYREEPYARSLHSYKRSSTPSPRNSIHSTGYNTWHNTSNSHNKVGSLRGSNKRFHFSMIFAKFQSNNTIAATNGTGQANPRSLVRDSNLGYIEYSDDEDAKSTDSKKGIVAATLEKFFKKMSGK